MDEQEIQKLVARQRRCFRSGATLSYKNRMAALTRLERLIAEHEPEFQEALKLDLGKSAAESYMCETGLLSYKNRMAAQHEMIRETGCDMVQGFYYSRVLPLPEALRYLESKGFIL